MIYFIVVIFKRCDIKITVSFINDSLNMSRNIYVHRVMVEMEKVTWVKKVPEGSIDNAHMRAPYNIGMQNPHAQHHFSNSIFQKIDSTLIIIFQGFISSLLFPLRFPAERNYKVAISTVDKCDEYLCMKRNYFFVILPPVGTENYKNEDLINLNSLWDDLKLLFYDFLNIETNQVLLRRKKAFRSTAHAFKAKCAQ